MMKHLLKSIPLVFAALLWGVPALTMAQVAGYTVTGPTTAVAPGASFSVSWVAPASANLSQDWVGIYRAGSVDTNYVAWAYTGNAAAGSMTFSLAEAGSYEARYFKNDGYSRAAVSAAITVQA